MGGQNINLTEMLTRVTKLNHEAFAVEYLSSMKVTHLGFCMHDDEKWNP